MKMNYTVTDRVTKLFLTDSTVKNTQCYRYDRSRLGSEEGETASTDQTVREQRATVNCHIENNRVLPLLALIANQLV